MDERFGVTTILRRMWTVVSLSRGPVLLFVGVVYGLVLLQDLYPDAVGLLVLASTVGLAANYLLLRSMLQEVGLKRAGEGGGFGSYFGVGMLSGLGVMLGLVLLVIPGIVLIVR